MGSVPRACWAGLCRPCGTPGRTNPRPPPGRASVPRSCTVCQLYAPERRPPPPPTPRHARPGRSTPGATLPVPLLCAPRVHRTGRCSSLYLRAHVAVGWRGVSRRRREGRGNDASPTQCMQSPSLVHKNRPACRGSSRGAGWRPRRPACPGGDFFSRFRLWQAALLTRKGWGVERAPPAVVKYFRALRGAEGRE